MRGIFTRKLVAPILILLAVSTLVLSQEIGPVKAQVGPKFTSVYLDPVRNTGLNGSSFKANVMLNLTDSVSMNAFDVRINYSSPHVVISPLLGSSGANYTGNLFKGFPSFVLHWCIDDVPVNNTANGCESDEQYGQVHFSQAILGQQLPGPITAGLLFSIQFNVVGNGTSFLSLDRANLASQQGLDPSHPNPHLLDNLKMGAIFANKGTVSYFILQPTTSIAFLPSEPVVFDARASFDADNASIAITSYSWNFGDGTSPQNKTSPLISHSFTSPQNYTVTLAVKNARGQPGTAFSSVLQVMPFLGAVTLALKPLTDTQRLVDPVTVKIFNSTSPTKPFEQGSTTGGLSFYGLSPGSYLLTISGPSIQNESRTETVSPGLTTTDTIYLTFIQPYQPFVLEILYGSVAAAVLAMAGIIVWKRVRSRRVEKSRRLRNKKS